jgi:hypothetical protein
MKSMLKYSMLALVLGVGSTTIAHASPWDPWDPWKPTPHDPPPSAPEVDPGMAISGITLLAGALTVMRSKRRK